jgi:protoheme ferro-lyase
LRNSCTFLQAFADSIREELQSGFSEQEREDVVLLFTAHSLPLSVVSKGDSYPLVLLFPALYSSILLIYIYLFAGSCGISEQNNGKSFL